MAEATLFRVTDEERRMAIELSDEKYRMYVEDERTAARREGSHQKAIETARNLLDMGLSPKNIARATGLDIKEIEQL